MVMSTDFRPNFLMINPSCFLDENLQEDLQQALKFLQNKGFFQLHQTLMRNLNFILHEPTKIEFLVSKFELKSTKNMFKRMI